MHFERTRGVSFYWSLLVALCLLSGYLQQSFARDVFRRDAAILTDSEDYEHLNANGEDVTFMKPSDILGKFGLKRIVPQLVSALDHADDLFVDVTSEKHFVAVNKIVKAFLDAFMQTLSPAMNAEDRPQGLIEPMTMNDLLKAVEQKFTQILSEDPLVSQSRLEPFVRQYADQIAATLTEAYSKVHQMGFKLSWSVLYMLPPILKFIPTEILSRDMFGEIIEVPGQLKQFVHDTLESVLSGDYAHFVQMAIQFASTMIASHTEKVEL